MHFLSLKLPSNQHLPLQLQVALESSCITNSPHKGSHTSLKMRAATQAAPLRAPLKDWKSKTNVPQLRRKPLWWLAQRGGASHPLVHGGLRGPRHLRCGLDVGQLLACLPCCWRSARWSLQHVAALRSWPAGRRPRPWRTLPDKGTGFLAGIARFPDDLLHKTDCPGAQWATSE